MDKASSDGFSFSRPAETTELNKYGDQKFENDCFIDLEEGKL